MTSHALVTGGAGCIGSDLAAALLHRGDRVTVIDNLSSGKFEHIAGLLAHPGFRFIEADLLDPATLDAAFTSAIPPVDMVYHLAANPDVKFVPGDPTDKDLQQNTICTYNVLESMRRHGIRRLAFSSTSAIYGICERQPIAEDQAPHPISLYGATKLSCEAMIGAFQHLFAMDCWIFRFANVVGPKVRKRGRTVIGDFIAKLRDDPTRLQVLGNGRQAKSYLLAEECVAAVLFAVDRAPHGLNIFNLGCDDSLSVNRIAEMVAAAMGLSRVALDYTGGEGGWIGDVPRFRLDVTAINRLGWQARYNSEEAVALAIEVSLNAYTATSHQPPTATHQPPTATHQPPTATHQPPTTTHQPPTATHQPPTATHQPPTATHQPPTATHQPPTATQSDLLEGGQSCPQPAFSRLLSEQSEPQEHLCKL
jgi:UDP-glucose 4-epimerase